MGGRGRGGRREGRGAIHIVDTLTSWPKSLPKDLQDLLVEPDLGLFLSLSLSLFPGLGPSWRPDLSLTHSLEVTEEVKERDPS